MKRTRLDNVGSVDLSNGFGHADGKKAKGSVLDQEFERQVSCLNQAFLTWVKSNSEGNPLSVWRDGCNDYIAYAQQLQTRFLSRGTPLTFDIN